jgi:hypothetical protein
MAKELKEEFTEKMFTELTISKEKETYIKVLLALKEIEENLFSKEHILKSYDLTQNDLDNFK